MPLAACLGSALLLGSGVSAGTNGTSAALGSFAALLRPSASDAALPLSERLHCGAALAWSDGRLRHAASLYEGALLQQPTDVLALRCLHDLYISLGDRANLVGSILRVLPAWTPGSAGYPSMLGMLANAHAECGQHRAAEETVGPLAHEKAHPSDAVRPVALAQKSLQVSSVLLNFDHKRP